MQVTQCVWLFLIGVTVAAGAFASQSVAQQRTLSQTTECALVPDARIALFDEEHLGNQPAWLSAIKAANRGHEVVAGDGYVLIIRQFRDDSTAVDAAQFLKVTLAVESVNLEIDEDEAMLVPVVDGYYVHGGVGFIHKGQYWQAQRPLSEISIRRIEDVLNVTLHATFSARFVATGESKQLTLDVTCDAPVKTVGVLTPWEGKPGASWESFAPREQQH